MGNSFLFLLYKKISNISVKNKPLLSPNLTHIQKKNNKFYAFSSTFSSFSGNYDFNCHNLTEIKKN